MSGRSAISKTELEVLTPLWEEGPATVRELSDRLLARGVKKAYTTVQTLLLRLENKGYVRSDKGRPAHKYAAILTREDVLNRRLQDLADQYCGGASSPLLLALVEGGRITPDDVLQLRRLLDRLDEGGSR